MVHCSSGADAIRQRRRAEAERRENEAKGIYTIPLDFKPAKNKKYPHYTPLRKPNIFWERQQLSLIRKRAIYSSEVQKCRSSDEPVSPPRSSSRPLDTSFQRRVSSSPITRRRRPQPSGYNLIQVFFCLMRSQNNGILFFISSSIEKIPFSCFSIIKFAPININKLVAFLYIA